MPLDRIWTESSKDSVATAVAVASACIVHVAIAVVASELPPKAHRAPPRSVEVELIAPPPAPPPSESEKPPESPPPEPAKAPTPKAATPKAAEPAPARAPNLITASEGGQDTPVRFASDPSGNEYVSGVVAAGARQSGQGTQPTPSAAPAPIAKMPPAPTFTTSFAQAPRLSERDPCRGSFPKAAAVDRGTATVEVALNTDGTPVRVDIVGEEPKSEGFGPAAVDCLRGKRFEPARDAAGAAVRAKTTVRIHFLR